MKRTLPLALAALLSAASLLAAVPAGASASRIVVRVAAKSLVAIPAAGGRQRLLVRAPEGALVASSAAANGRTVAYSSRTSESTPEGPAITDTVWVKRGDRQPRPLRTFVSIGRERQSSPVSSLSLSPSGRQLLITQRGGTVLAMNANGRGTRRVSVPGFRFAVGPHPNSSGAKFTPDGRQIVAALEATTGGAQFECGVALLPASGGRPRFLRSGRKFAGISRYTAPVLAPDGRSIAFLEHLRDYERLLVMRPDGSGAHEVARPLRDGWQLANPTFSPSGQALAFIAERAFSGPSRLYTVRRSGAGLRLLQTETAYHWLRNPTWVR